MKKFIYLFIAIVVLCVSCSKDDLPASTPIDYSNAQLFFEELGYNGAVLISKSGNDIIRKGLGEANHKTGELNTVTTKFRIGSVSKTLTGMAIIQLKRDGLIAGFDQSLSDLDPIFSAFSEITLRQLLRHQSGIPDYVSMVEDAAKTGEDISPMEIFELLEEYVSTEGWLFQPGTSMQYSNSNYLLAALLIEKLAGISYESYVLQHILQPLHMQHTELGTNTIPSQGYAQGYNGTQNVSDYPMPITIGAGCWTSTVEDMEIWCKTVMGDEWLTDEEKNVIWGMDVAAETTVFGMSWFVSTINNKKFIWHGGDIDGFSSLIGFIPESEGVIIALSNEQDNTAFTRNTIIETILHNEF
nr:serine hydrolase domain-containing protein [uncultured Carboxylicivirga sp.]